MRVSHQFSVPLANKPGRLATVLDGLAKEKARVLAFSVMDSGSHATLRLVPAEAEPAKAALDALGVDYEETDVLIVELSSRTGSMQKVCRRLAEEHLNIDYAYGAIDAAGGKSNSIAVIRVNNLAKAQRVLASATANGHERPKKRPRKRPAVMR